MSTYKIKFSNGDAPIEVDGWINVEPTLRAKYGHAVQIGHDGDLQGRGDHTLFWDPDVDTTDDDGALALGSVVRLVRT